MKSPYEVESERIAVSFIIAFIILVVIALVFHKELISYLSEQMSEIDNLTIDGTINLCIHVPQYATFHDTVS